MTVIDRFRNPSASVDHSVIARLANEFRVPVRTVERAFSEVLDSIPAHADILHIDFVVESRARMRLFRASLVGL
jgi:hypothetical protein